MKTVICDICKESAELTDFKVPVPLNVYGGKGNREVAHGIGLTNQEINLCTYHQQAYADFYDSLLRGAGVRELTK